MSKKLFIIILPFLILAIFAAGFFWVRAERIKKENIAKQESVVQKAAEETLADAVQETVVPKIPAVIPEEEKSENSENKFTFAKLGDTQRFNVNDKNGALQKAVAEIKKQNVDFVVSTGDIISGCGSECAEKLKNWKNVMGPLAGKVYVAMGNHDRSDENKSDKVFQDSFSFPTNGPSGYSELVYSFDYKNSHFVFLNSEKPEENLIDSKQRNWLESDLAGTRKENKFIFFHAPAYPLSSKIGESLDEHVKDRDALWAIFKKYNVTAVFNGHEHIHSRRNVEGIWQFDFGNTDSFDHELPKSGADFSYRGQAFGIVEVDGRNIKVKTISVDGKIINEFSFSK